MIIVSGDIKDLGRMMKANRGVEYIFGYMPNELQGNKINKVMPRLFSQVHDEFIGNFLKRGHSSFIDKNQFLLIENKMRFIQMTMVYIKAMVDLKMGLMFVSFFKLPLKVPNNYEGNQYIKAKDAHYILCDSNGNIHGMSYNCMKNLGIPPTIISKTNKQPNSISIIDNNNMSNIQQFAPNILGPEYEFDLPKGLNFSFDTTVFKNDKYLAKEFHELTGRMRKYNIFVSMRKHEYRLSPSNVCEILLFTVEILSFQLSEAPITIPVDKTDDPSYSQYTGTTVSSVNSDELRTSKFKEFKTQVQDLKVPSKIALLRKITIAFFIFLLAVFSLNYALCATQNSAYMDRVDILDILFELENKIPSTSRYVRTCVDISMGYEDNQDEVIKDRFLYYMTRIAENAEIFRNLQQNIYTTYSSQLALNDVRLKIKDLQTDYSIKQIDSTISSALNMFSSKSLQFSKRKMSQLKNITIPYLSFEFDAINKSKGNITDLEQDLFFILENGHSSIPAALKQLDKLSQDKILSQSETFQLVSLIIAIVSIFVNFLIIPIVYPLLVHYERLAYYILHSFNKLTKKFVENEVKSCNQLFTYIGKKQGSGGSGGATENQGGTMMKKPEARKENKQLMKVNPKITKYVLDQERKKKGHRGQKSQKSRRSHYEDEEEKIQINIERFADQNQSVTGMHPDEGSALLDEDLDENTQHKVSRQQVRSQGRAAIGRQTTRGPGRRISVRNQGSIEINTASVASIDESTIQTSIEMNSSTNKSSGDDTTSDNQQDDDEDASYSQTSSQSNYTHYTNVSHWKHLRQAGAYEQSRYGQGNGANGMKSNGMSFVYDMTHAKSSELAGDVFNVERENFELSEEEKEFKRQVRERQNKIKQSLKRRKCTKVIYLIILVIVISIYLGVNAMYTRFVFQYEEHLQEDIKIIDRRILCYPITLTLLKEMIARNQSISYQFYDVEDKSKHESDRVFLVTCYENEKKFLDTILGAYKINGQSVLASQYLSIADSLAKDKFCPTLYLEFHPEKYEQCDSSYNGLNNLGLTDVLSFILREGEKIIYQYENVISQKGDKQELIGILKESSLNELETIKDIFIDDAFILQRNLMIDEIVQFAKELFRIFDILFSVFVAVCFLMVSFGVIYMIKRLQSLIIQIYHIVLLIPYGERTKRELNELNNPDLQKKGEEIYQQSSDSQRQKFYNEVEILLQHPYDGPIAGVANKNDVVILNTLNQDQQNWMTQSQFQNASYSMNQSSLFNDSKFVPYEQLQVQNIDDPKLNTANFTPTVTQGFLPSNSMQLSLDQFKASSQQQVILPPQNLPNTQYITQQNIDPLTQGNNQAQNAIQAQLISQYEQVMQLMHQEIQKLISHNKELSDQKQIRGQDFQQIQMVTKEKDELLETLRQREQIIIQLRMEQDIQNQNLIDLQNNGFKGGNLQEAQLKLRNEQLQEKTRKIEKQVREQEQTIFEMESMNRNLKRDLKHQTLINEQIKQEQIEINEKRDNLDMMLQDAKSKLAQTVIQTRQLQLVIDQQQSEITNLSNQKNQYEKFAEQANFDNERLREQLNEGENQKLQQFQALEVYQRENSSIKALGRRLLALIQTHREEYGDFSDQSYELLFRDISNVNLSYQPPQANLYHLQRSQSPRQVKFEIGNQALMKTKPRITNENPGGDYYQMVDQLAQYVRDQAKPSHYSSVSSGMSQRQKSPGRGDEWLGDRQKPILKNASVQNLNEQQQPVISWVSGALEQPKNAQQHNRVRQGKSPDKKSPNVQGMKNTLASLVEEKNNLERQLKSGGSLKSSEEIKFELDLATSNINRIKEKLQAAGAQ